MNEFKERFELVETERCNLVNKLKMEQLYDLYETIEMPLIKVLAGMEIEGIICDKDIEFKEGEFGLSNVAATILQMMELDIPKEWNESMIK